MSISQFLSATDSPFFSSRSVSLLFCFRFRARPGHSPSHPAHGHGLIAWKYAEYTCAVALERHRNRFDTPIPGQRVLPIIQPACPLVSCFQRATWNLITSLPALIDRRRPAETGARGFREGSEGIPLFRSLDTCLRVPGDTRKVAVDG